MNDYKIFTDLFKVETWHNIMLGWIKIFTDIFNDPDWPILVYMFLGACIFLLRNWEMDKNKY